MSESLSICKNLFSDLVTSISNTLIIINVQEEQSNMHMSRFRKARHDLEEAEEIAHTTESLANKIQVIKRDECTEY